MPSEMLFFSSLNTHGPLWLGLADCLQQLARSLQEQREGTVVWFATFATEAEEVAQPLNREMKCDPCTSCLCYP